MIEHFFDCPQCWQNQIKVVDPSIEEQNFINVDQNGTAEENGHQSRLDDFKVQGQIKGNMGKRKETIIN